MERHGRETYKEKIKTENTTLEFEKKTFAANPSTACYELKGIVLLRALPDLLDISCWQSITSTSKTTFSLQHASEKRAGRIVLFWGSLELWWRSGSESAEEGRRSRCKTYKAQAVGVCDASQPCKHRPECAHTEPPHPQPPTPAFIFPGLAVTAT